MKICPKCEANWAFTQIKKLESTHARETFYARACGLLEATLEYIARSELSVCDDHSGPPPDVNGWPLPKP